MIKSEQSNRKTIAQYSIIILSIIGLLSCVAVLFPQVRQIIMDLAERVFHREASTYQMWLKSLLSYAMGGICLILFFDYCTLTQPGRALVQTVKQEIKDCLSEIEFKSFTKPLLLMSGIYLLGISTIVRANFYYFDDIGRSMSGGRGWYNWSRYVSEFSSIFVHGDFRLTDISPVPQLLSILILSCSSVLLVYVIGKGKITTVRLLASVPLGLSPFILECLSFKYDAPYMTLSVLASIVPFLFIARKKAFVFCSVVSLLIMCMTYQSVSGVYLLITIVLCFLDWNSREKPEKEILSFLGTAVFSFCFAMLIFRFFLMKPSDDYVSNAMHPVTHIISGTLNNIKEYVLTINHDLGIIWKAGIALVFLFFIAKSICRSAHKKAASFFISILVTGISFILSYGVYSLLVVPLFAPRACMGFGVLLAVLCIYVVSGYKKIALITVLALNWCFFVFAFSYGNALADQARYAEFRNGILLHDLSALYPDRKREEMTFQLKNEIDYTPSIMNISKHYPVIEKLIPKRLGDSWWDVFYFLEYYHFGHFDVYKMPGNTIDFSSLNLPVVLDSYYHTIKSDGTHCLIELKH